MLLKRYYLSIKDPQKLAGLGIEIINQSSAYFEVNIQLDSVAIASAKKSLNGEEDLSIEDLFYGIGCTWIYPVPRSDRQKFIIPDDYDSLKAFKTYTRKRKTSAFATVKLIPLITTTFNLIITRIMEDNRDSIKKELCDSLFWTVAYQNMESLRIGQLIIVDVIPHKKQVETNNIHPDSFSDRVEEYKSKYPHTFTSAGLNAVDKYIRKNPKHKVTIVVIDLSEMGLKIKNNLLAVIVMNPTQIGFVRSLLTSCRSLFS